MCLRKLLESVFLKKKIDVLKKDCEEAEQDIKIAEAELRAAEEEWGEQMTRLKSEVRCWVGWEG